MFIGYVVVTVLVAFVLFSSAFLTFTRNPKIVDTMTRLGVPDSWLPWLATAKTAGALGLLAGIFVPPLGVAAATGLVLYFVGALIAHLRGKDYAMAPVVVLVLLSAAALVLRVTSA